MLNDIWGYFGAFFCGLMIATYINISSWIKPKYFVVCKTCLKRFYFITDRKKKLLSESFYLTCPWNHTHLYSKQDSYQAKN